MLWAVLSPLYMGFPQTQDAWRLLAANFEAKWNFPHCVGALDGKHVVMRSPGNSGSLYFNYKGTFSIVLLALVDANLRFIAIDVGAYGRNSDGGIFANSVLGKCITDGSINFPDDCALPSATHLGPMPYVIIGDEAFPLQRHLMRPFPGRGCPQEEQIFNYRLSRGRRIVENAFGILAARWRVFHTKMGMRVEWGKDIVKAACVLHNYMQIDSTPAQITALCHEAEATESNSLIPLQARGNRAAGDAIAIRNKFKEYFVVDAPLDWQTDHVQRGLVDH